MRKLIPFTVVVLAVSIGAPILYHRSLERNAAMKASVAESGSAVLADVPPEETTPTGPSEEDAEKTQALPATDQVTSMPEAIQNPQPAEAPSSPYKTYSIHGRIVDSGEWKAIPGVQVFLANWDRTLNYPQAQSALESMRLEYSDEEGYFKFSGLWPATYGVITAHDIFVQPEPALKLTIDPEFVEDLLVLVMAKGGIVTGNVKFKGLTLRRKRITLVYDDVLIEEEYAFTDEVGTFIFQGLVPGPVKVKTEMTLTIGTTRVSIPALVETGQETVVDLIWDGLDLAMADQIIPFDRVKGYRPTASTFNDKDNRQFFTAAVAEDGSIFFSYVPDRQIRLMQM